MSTEVIHVEAVDMTPTSGGVVTKPLDPSEGFARLARMQAHVVGLRGPGQPVTEGEGMRAERARLEADVVEAARRSQAEIRRHVDSYLKEHFETIAQDVAKVVIDQVHERILKGVAGMQETQAIALDRLAADVRKQLRAFAREAWGADAKPAKKAASRATSRRDK